MSLDEEASNGRRSAPLPGGPGSARSKRLGSVPNYFPHYSRKNSKTGGSSLDLSTSIVPEDFELPVEEAVSPHLEANLVNMPLNETTSALFRKR